MKIEVKGGITVRITNLQSALAGVIYNQDIVPSAASSQLNFTVADADVKGEAS